MQFRARASTPVAEQQGIRLLSGRPQVQFLPGVFRSHRPAARTRASEARNSGANPDGSINRV